MHSALEPFAKEGEPACPPLLAPDRLAMLRGLRTSRGRRLLFTAIEAFLHRGPSDLEEMREALAMGDLDGLRQMAHTLSGSSGALGAGLLSERCCELQALAQSGDPTGCAAGLREVEALSRCLFQELTTLALQERTANA